MHIYELRAIWREEYDCPDNGPTYICDASDTIAVQVDGRDRLDAIAADLSTGFGDGYWNEKRAKHLRNLYPSHDSLRDTRYEVRDLSEFIIGVQS